MAVTRSIKKKPTIKEIQKQLMTLSEVVAETAGQMTQVPTIAREEARRVIEEEKKEVSALLIEARLLLRSLVDATETARKEKLEFSQDDLNKGVTGG